MKHDEPTAGRLGAFRPTRRQFVTGLASGGAALGLGLARLPASAGTPARRGGAAQMAGTAFALSIGAMPVDITGRHRPAITVNDSPCSRRALIRINPVNRAQAFRFCRYQATAPSSPSCPCSTRHTGTRSNCSVITPLLR